MFGKKSRIVTLETLIGLCDKEVNYRHQILKKETKIIKAKSNDVEIKKINIKQTGEEILWL